MYAFARNWLIILPGILFKVNLKKFNNRAVHGKKKKEPFFAFYMYINYQLKAGTVHGKVWWKFFNRTKKKTTFLALQF